MAVYECVLNWTFQSNIYNTVLHYQNEGAGEPDFQELTDNIASKFILAYRSVLVPSISFTSIRWREDIAGGVGTVFFPTGGPQVGNASDDQTIGQAAAIIRKLTTGLTRPNKGRIYQPGVSVEGTGANGLWTATVTTALNNFWETMLDIQDTQPVLLNMVIKASNPTAPNTVAYNQVTAVQALGNPGTQRRRRLGVGQ